MKTIIHDLGEYYNSVFVNKYDHIISADGKYAPCQGCFKCWTKNPAQCNMKDSLQNVCRIIGSSEELVIVTENCYGAYSPSVKRVLDRSIGMSTPLSTYREKQMHHFPRYGKRKKISVYVYGDITDEELKTFRYMVERNAVNLGYCQCQIQYMEKINDVEEIEI